MATRKRAQAKAAPVEQECFDQLAGWAFLSSVCGAAPKMIDPRNIEGSRV
jgi:hypothetical protein